MLQALKGFDLIFYYKKHPTLYILFSNTGTYVQPKGPILLLFKSVGVFAFASAAEGEGTTFVRALMMAGPSVFPS